jgi:Xaa-Pro dipeptidase
MTPSRRPFAVVLCLAALAAVAAPGTARADDAAAIRSRVDVEAAQAILAVQSLDGWLLAGTGNQNPIAAELVNPDGTASRPWFYFIPAKGQPVALVHKSESAAFDDVPGKKIEYAGQRDLKNGLRELLRGSHTIAMEYAPKSGIPALTRIDAGTALLVKSTGVTIESSAELVQFTKSLWGPEGRVGHYLAMHHLSKLVAGALAHLRSELEAGHKITEYDLQQWIASRAKMRGLEGPPPVVASGSHSANPQFVPSRRNARSIEAGDLVLIDVSARVADAERPIYARLGWVAYVGDQVPERYASVFASLAAARDDTIAFIADRIARKRPVRGFEADQLARSVLGKAGLVDKAVHKTGHSLDTSLAGDGANLDDYEAHDTRALVLGSGFTVGPGVYVKGDFGMRTVTDVYLGRQGVEKTGPVQAAITPVLAR